MPKSKPPPEGDLLDPGQAGGQPPASSQDDALGVDTSLTPEHIRNTPEYRELARQNRILARQAGEQARQVAAARAAAEAAQQAAEAERIAAQEARVREILGDDGVDAWERFSDLSTTDPVAAAELLAQFVATRAQSAGSGAQPPAAATGGEQVPQTPPEQGKPPATGLSRTVGDAPLGGPADDTSDVIAGLEKRFAETVERNQDPRTRNRVTMRDRGAAMIGYLGAAYLKAGAKPKS